MPAVRALILRTTCISLARNYYSKLLVGCCVRALKVTLLWRDIGAFSKYLPTLHNTTPRRFFGFFFFLFFLIAVRVDELIYEHDEWCTSNICVTLDRTTSSLSWKIITCVRQYANDKRKRESKWIFSCSGSREKIWCIFGSVIHFAKICARRG